MTVRLFKTHLAAVDRCKRLPSSSLVFLDPFSKIGPNSDVRKGGLFWVGGCYNTQAEAF